MVDRKFEKQRPEGNRGSRTEGLGGGGEGKKIASLSIVWKQNPIFIKYERL